MVFIKPCITPQCTSNLKTQSFLPVLVQWCCQMFHLWVQQAAHTMTCCCTSRLAEKTQFANAGELAFHDDSRNCERRGQSNSNDAHWILCLFSQTSPSVFSPCAYTTKIGGIRLRRPIGSLTSLTLYSLSLFLLYYLPVLLWDKYTFYLFVPTMGCPASRDQL